VVPTSHPLLTLLLAAADGRYPPVDGGVTVLPPLRRGLECSVAFTGHAVVATALSEETVLGLGANGFGGSLTPGLLSHLAGPGGWIDVIDVTLVARGTGRASAPPSMPAAPSAPSAPSLPERHDAEDFPRVRHARDVRRGVRVYGDERGVVTLAADGLAGRRELSIELEGSERTAGRGAGRALLRDALDLVPAGEPVFAAVSPGNARSLRAFLSLGFTPIGSEALIRPDLPASH
jgi:hypothetical protein